MMDTLVDKYKKDRLSPAELHELRKQINASSDRELEETLEADWNQGNFPVDKVEASALLRMKQHIDKRIKSGKSWRIYASRIGTIAAAILLPLFIISTFYLYHENKAVLSSDMIVSTGKGEKATVILPDGTKVSLNFNSQVTYAPASYNKEKRQIKFDGEAYFQVKKDSEHPFVINARGMEVCVLGTTFNLLTRNEYHSAELALEEGSVRLSSTRTGKSVVLKPMQKAILSYETGDIVVHTMDNENDLPSAWQKGDLQFKNRTLNEVLRTLESCYAYRITADCYDCLNDTFTGTLPSANIHEALEVLEKSFHFKIEIKGQEIILHR